ncbi:MAG: N-acetylmuramoyl-L-alanine amidase, partial [Deltaproteobacteria bacterium]|nr:N-acetylmuramoyl-L-alanine amidase [Deltaproteobacteria bacterium]
MRELLVLLAASLAVAAAGCGRKAVAPEAPPDDPLVAAKAVEPPVEPVTKPEPEPEPEPEPGLPEWIVDKPVLFDEEREALSLQYAKDHYGLDDFHIVPRMVVVHWTAGKSWQGAFKTFNKAKLSGRPFLQKYGQLNVAAHYLVARDGTVYKLLPDHVMGRHVIGLNHCALGIENVGNDDLTAEQLESNVKLVEYLAGRHESIEYLIGHYEYL